MNSLRRFTTRWLWLAPLLGVSALQGAELSGGSAQSPNPPAAQPAAAPKPGSCGKFGTQVEFVATPSAAARQALKEQKLVFVLHVSGHFEDPRFT